MRSREVSGAPAVSRDTSSGTCYVIRVRKDVRKDVREDVIVIRVFASRETPVPELDKTKSQNPESLVIEWFRTIVADIV